MTFFRTHRRKAFLVLVMCSRVQRIDTSPIHPIEDGHVDLGPVELAEDMEKRLIDNDVEEPHGPLPVRLVVPSGK